MSNTMKEAILSKVATMKTTVLNSCSACGNTPDPQGKTGAEKARTAYTNSFNNLTTAINNYYNAMSPVGFFASMNLGQWQKNLYDIITLDFTREMRKNYTFNPPDEAYPTEDLPVGESDYMELYGMNGMYNQIMAYSNNHYFIENACLTAETSPSIEADVSAINSAINGDLDLQKNFIDWLRYYPNKNQLINVTENQDLVLESSTMPNKEEIGYKIYITKHAKQIIEAFGFDIYIPTYVRNL